MMLLGNSMQTAISATGHIKKYQLWVTIVGCMVFPLTWIAYQWGLPPTTTYVIYIIIYFLLIFVRVYVAKGIIKFPVKLYLTDVMARILIVSTVSFVPPLLIIFNMEESFLRLCITCSINLISTTLAISAFGLTKSERKKIKAKLFFAIKSK